MIRNSNQAASETRDALRAQIKELREALQSVMREYDARTWSDPASGLVPSQARAALEHTA